MKNRRTAMKPRIAIMGKAKAAMKLNGAIGGKAICCIRRRLGHAHGDFANALVAETVGGAVYMRPRLFIFDISVDNRVLQRLIFAD